MSSLGVDSISWRKRNHFCEVWNAHESWNIRDKSLLSSMKCENLTKSIQLITRKECTIGCNILHHKIYLFNTDSPKCIHAIYIIRITAFRKISKKSVYCIRPPTETVQSFLNMRVYLFKVHWSRGTHPQVDGDWDSPRQQQLFPYHLTAY